MWWHVSGRRVCQAGLLAMVFGALSPLHAQDLGDIDGDGTATVRDVALVVQFLNNEGSLTERQQVLADYDGDGGVSQEDVDLLVSEIIGDNTQTPLPLCSVKMTTPGAGDGNIGTATKVIVDFNMPLAAGTSLSDTNFYAEFGGAKLPASIVVADNRRKASLAFISPLPANARVQVVLIGTGINDVFARATDLDGDYGADGWRA